MPNIFDIISGFVFPSPLIPNPKSVLHELDVVQHKPTGSQLFGLLCLLFYFCGVSSRFSFMCRCYPPLSIFSLCLCFPACCRDAWFRSHHMTWFFWFLEPDQDIVAPLSFRSLTIRRAPSTDVSGNYTTINWSCVPIAYYVLILPQVWVCAHLQKKHEMYLKIPAGRLDTVK